MDVTLVELLFATAAFLAGVVWVLFSWSDADQISYGRRVDLEREDEETK